MAGGTVFRKNALRKWFNKWFGAKRGTHWSIAGSVAVIIFGCYVIYNSHDSRPTTIATISAAQPSAPMTPGPFPSKR
jgi:hypothetical protein